MYDVFGNSSGLQAKRRFKKRPALALSSSFGVRNGFVAGAERPLPAGVENLRAARRLPLTFEVGLEGKRLRVAGDLSAGGAMFLLPYAAGSHQVEVFFRVPGEGEERRVQGQLLACYTRGRRFAHHVRFVQVQADQLAAAIEKAAAAARKA